MPLLQQVDRRDRPSERTSITVTSTDFNIDCESCLALAKFYDEQPNETTKKPKNNKQIRQIKRVQKPESIVM